MRSKSTGSHISNLSFLRHFPVMPMVDWVDRIGLQFSYCVLNNCVSISSRLREVIIVLKHQKNLMNFKK